MAGNPIVARAAAEEGRDLADAIGDGSDLAPVSPHPWNCTAIPGRSGGRRRTIRRLGWPRPKPLTMWSAGRPALRTRASHSRGRVTRVRPARPPTQPSKPPSDAWQDSRGRAYSALAIRGPGRRRYCDGSGAPARPTWLRLSLRAPDGGVVACVLNAQAAMAGGDLIAARRRADEAVTTMTGWYSIGGADDARAAWRSPRVNQSRPSVTPTTRSRSPPKCRRIWVIPDTLECLAALAGESGSHREAARLFGAAARHPAAHGRGALQGLGRGLRSLGGSAA